MRAPFPAKPFVPRIVPIDPKLTEVDLDRPEMLFYYPGDLRTTGELVALVDGREAARGTLDVGRRVRRDNLILSWRFLQGVR